MINTINKLKEKEKEIKEMATQLENIDRILTINYQNGRETIEGEIQEVIKFQSEYHPEIVKDGEYGIRNKDEYKDSYKLTGYILQNGEIFVAVIKLDEHPIESELLTQNTYYISKKDNDIKIEKT